MTNSEINTPDNELISLPKKPLKKGNEVIIVNRLTPVMTESLFAKVSGLTRGEVRGQADRQNLPTVRYGRKRLINIRQIERDCEEA